MDQQIFKLDALFFLLMYYHLLLIILGYTVKNLAVIAPVITIATRVQLIVTCYNIRQDLTIVCSHSLLTSSRIKGVNCVECKLLHCEYKASRGVDYQTMPLQCIVFFGSQHAI